uniref:RING-type domain-containing protein n=1 Tax=Anopheles maculatus TaxID=74869 RepID=A0A182SV09_9DIPT
MVLSAIGNFIYNFYCLLYHIVAIVSYAGYLLYCIIHNVSWIVLWCLQNGTAFTQMVYEDNRHLIQDTKTFLAGISNFFVTNVGNVCSAVVFVARAIWGGTIAFLLALQLSIWGAKQCLVLIGDAVWMLFTAPYQLMVLFDGLLSDGWKLLLETAQSMGKEFVAALVNVKLYVIQEIPAQSAWGLLLLALIYQYPAPMVAMLNYFKEMVSSGFCFVRAKLRRPYGLAVDYLSNAYRFAMLKRNAIDSVRQSSGQAEVEPMRRRPTPNRSAVGNCILCEDNERTVAFIPCGHLCACKACARALCHYNPVCPLCRKFIERKLEIYI